MGRAQTALVQLALHAKMHQQLDSLQTKISKDVERIEAAEIRAYENDTEFARLEELKSELLSIRFVEKK